MVISHSNRLEKKLHRRWRFLTGSGLLAGAVAIAGLGLKADSLKAAPRPDEPKATEPKGETPPANSEEELAAKQKKLREMLQQVEKERKDLQENKPGAVPPAQLLLPNNFQNFLLDEQALKELNAAMQQMQQQQQLFLQDGLGGFAFGMPPRNPRLGVQVASPTPELIDQLDLPRDHALVIQEVLPDTPAAKAGFKKNDILIEFGGKKVPDSRIEFVKMLDEFKADEALEAKVMRKGKMEKIAGIKLAKKDDKAAQPAVNPFGMMPMQRFQMAVPNFGNAGGTSSSTSVSMVNGEFTINSKTDGREIQIKGRKDGDGKTVTGITIKDNGETFNSDKLESVPEKHKEAVKKLLESIR